MAKFFGCLFAGILGIIIAVFILFGNIINVILSFLGLKKRSTNSGRYYGQNDAYDSHGGYTQEQQRQQQSAGSNGQQNTAGKKNGKIFEKDDSEYVDFEEI